MLIHLASQSPRRRELFTLLGLPFATSSPSIIENRGHDEKPEEYVIRLSREKAHVIADKQGASGWVVAADTVVVLDDWVLEKPRDDAEAFKMLSALRGRIHQVLTSVTIWHDDALARGVLVTSMVPMREYSEEEIIAYIDAGDPFDKAGAYGIQHAGFHPSDRFCDCFANVMGLPLCHLYRLLAEEGLQPPAGIQHRCQVSLGYSCPVFQDILPAFAL